jgi:hypothetical protein
VKRALTTGSCKSPASGCNGPCYSDNWLPSGDQEWLSYYHSEYRGFNAVITRPTDRATSVSYFYSTLGWRTPESAGGDFNAGQRYQQDTFDGSIISDATLLSRTTISYPGVTGGPFETLHACDTTQDAVYTPCLVAPLRSKTVVYEAEGISATAPWAQTDSTYDDLTPTSGYTAAGYHNLLKTVTTSSNAPAVTQEWTYKTNDTQVNGIDYYTVNAVASSKIVDATTHIWQCEDRTYDEGRPAGVPEPVAGWVTTSTAYRDCNSSNKANTALKSYTGYDQLGNAVASVDSRGAAHPDLYSEAGCTLATAPALLAAAWTTGRFTSCASYANTPEQYYAAFPFQQQDALEMTETFAYDRTQGYVPISTTDVNAQVTSTSSVYETDESITANMKEPLETGSYTTRTRYRSTCTASTILPCSVVETNA